ncbi:hypothetical protein [Pedosphaera parvula]|uniref:DUF1328 domain-containing protein n=1 Tax=Pedosphaera parvula (strain Ellin514) TaxID=320771 RepID=B9XK08_PEDPL|nr:hypothetical protein [Pedosphaera parvula]EEF59831.1 hypothetical protein Cflav_PD2838 [Pedosphaera parvula Ellin514]
MKLSTMLLLLCIVGLVLGLADVGSPALSGVSRALGATFFVLFFLAWCTEGISANKLE